MSGSFTKVNYTLRPAKGIERRMMADAFLRLRPFGSVESYRYVGMGSVYFADFSLFHSLCGFTDLVSIEDAQDDTTKERFKFNVPLGSIDLRFGHSNVELPKLRWDGVRTICWLDYDGGISREVLTDVRFLATKMSTGSMLIVTVDARLGRDDQATAQGNLSELINLIGEEKIPTDITAARALKRSEIRSTLRTIMVQEAADGANERNAGMPKGQRTAMEQIFNFEYSDKAPMLTVGWVLFDEGQRGRFNECEFTTDKLRFVRVADEPFVIEPPFLTPREMRELNRCDEKDTYRPFDLPLPSSERKKYDDVRRYWPTGGYAEMT